MMRARTDPMTGGFRPSTYQYHPKHLIYDKNAQVPWFGGSLQDVYRLLHHCLAPLAPSLGVVPYNDRVHAARAAPPVLLHDAYRSGGRQGEYRTDLWRRRAVSAA